ncbi:MAG: RDD family protein [Micrococcaceae bacterium]
MEESYPGKRLDLPQTGPNSIATPGKRVAALFIDWMLCYAVSALFFQASSVAVLGIFFIEQVLSIGLIGSSPGQALMGLRVGSLPGKKLHLGTAAIRSALLCLVLPAAILDQDQRGLHEQLPGLVLVKK